MKTIKQIADELGVSKQSIRNEIAKQGLQSTLRKNGNQFAIDESCEVLIKSAFENRKGKITAKVVCKDNANQNAKVTDNKNEKVCDYQHRIEVLETDNKRLKEEIELLKEQLAENKENTIHLKAQLEKKDIQIDSLNGRLQEALFSITQLARTQALEDKKEDIVEHGAVEPTSESEPEQEKKKWWKFW